MLIPNPNPNPHLLSLAAELEELVASLASTQVQLCTSLTLSPCPSLKS